MADGAASGLLVAWGRPGGRLSSWGLGTLVFSHFQRLYFITLPGGVSRCLTARCLSLLLLSHLVPVVAVGVFCVIDLVFVSRCASVPERWVSFKLLLR